jgi:hypothetical protein
LQVPKESHVYGATRLLQAIATHRHEVLDLHLPMLSKLMQRQTKEHAIKESQRTSSSSTVTDDSFGLQTLKRTIQLMASKIMEVPEHRKVMKALHEKPTC